MTFEEWFVSNLDLDIDDDMPADKMACKEWARCAWEFKEKIMRLELDELVTLTELANLNLQYQRDLLKKVMSRGVQE